MSKLELFVLCFVCSAAGFTVAWYLVRVYEKIWNLKRKVWKLRTQIIYWDMYDRLSNDAFKQRFKEIFITEPENMFDPEEEP